jgi:hypothetical protein
MIGTRAPEGNLSKKITTRPATPGSEGGSLAIAAWLSPFPILIFDLSSKPHPSATHPLLNFKSPISNLPSACQPVPGIRSIRPIFRVFRVFCGLNSPALFSFLALFKSQISHLPLALNQASHPPASWRRLGSAALFAPTRYPSPNNEYRQQSPSIRYFARLAC